jgi:hypothetical protein
MQSHGADSKQFAIPPKGGFKAIFISFFISGIGVIRGCSSLFVVAAERSEAALGPWWFLFLPDEDFLKWESP